MCYFEINQHEEDLFVAVMDHLQPKFIIILESYDYNKYVLQLEHLLHIE